MTKSGRKRHERHPKSQLGRYILFEHRNEPLLPRRDFYWRLARHAGAAILVMGASLGIGILGYHLTEGLPWLDSLLNASMILGGMGPVNPLASTAGKLFASFYALFSGILFLVIASILMAPVVHRFLHKLHLNVEEDEQKK